jgi:hypothetical protein
MKYYSRKWCPVCEDYYFYTTTDVIDDTVICPTCEDAGEKFVVVCFFCL